MDMSFDAYDHYSQPEHAYASGSAQNNAPFIYQPSPFAPESANDLAYSYVPLSVYESTLHQPVGVRPIQLLLAPYSSLPRGSSCDIDSIYPPQPCIPAPVEFLPRHVRHSSEDDTINHSSIQPPPPPSYAYAETRLSYSSHLPLDNAALASCNAILLEEQLAASESGPLEGETVAGSLDLSTGQFYHGQEHPRLRTAQACEKCRMRKAKCSGESPCKRCALRGLVCEYVGDRKVRAAVKNRSRRGSVRDRSGSDASLSSVSSAPDDPMPATPTSDHAQDWAQQGLEHLDHVGGSKAVEGAATGLEEAAADYVSEQTQTMPLHIGMGSTIYRRRLSCASDHSPSSTASSLDVPGTPQPSDYTLVPPQAGVDSMNSSSLLMRRRARSLCAPIMTSGPSHSPRSAGTVPPSPLGQWSFEYSQLQNFRFGNPPPVQESYVDHEVTPKMDLGRDMWANGDARVA